MPSAQRQRRAGHRQRREAQQEQARTDLERDRAQQAQKNAERQRDLARAGRGGAREAENEARRNMYFAQINLAQQAWTSGDISQALEILGRLVPAAGEVDVRGFEYFRLWKLCHQSILTLAGHTQGVLSLARSVDGKKLVSGSLDDTVRVWNLESGEPLFTLQEGRYNVSGVAISPDDDRIASCHYDGMVRVWDVQTRKCLHRLRTGRGLNYSVPFSPDGKLLATGSTGGEVHVWHAESGEEYANFKFPQTSLIPCGVWATRFSPDGTILALAGGPIIGTGTVLLWDVAAKKPLKRLAGHRAVILAMDFSPDGSRLATGAVDQALIVWDVESGTSEMTFRGHRGSVTAVKFSIDGRSVFSGSTDRTVRIWDLDQRRLAKTLRAHSNVVTALLVTPDGQRIVSGSADTTIRVWDPELPPGYEVIDARPEGDASGGASPILAALSGQSEPVYPVTSVSVAPENRFLATVTVRPVGKGSAQLIDRGGGQSRTLTDPAAPDRSYPRRPLERR